MTSSAGWRAWAAVAAAAAPYGADSEALRRALVAVAAGGTDRGRIIDRALERLGAADEVPLAPLLEAFRASVPRRLSPYPGVRAALRTLRDEVPIGLVTPPFIAPNSSSPYSTPMAGSRAKGRVTVDANGVRRTLARGKAESVRWDELVEVRIRTTADGPLAEDVFYVLVGRGGAGCVIPQGLAPDGFVERLLTLPGFDSGQLIESMGSVVQAEFVCWRAAAR